MRSVIAIQVFKGVLNKGKFSLFVSQSGKNSLAQRYGSERFAGTLYTFQLRSTVNDVLVMVRNFFKLWINTYLVMKCKLYFRDNHVDGKATSDV